MPWFVNCYLAAGVLIAAFSIYTFIRSYKEISGAELLFAIAMIPLWPIMAYYTIYNYLEMIKEEKKDE